MSDWWVTIESVEGLDNPRYRLGDLQKRWKADNDDPKIKNVILEFVSGKNSEAVKTSNPFDVDDTGCAKVGQVLQIARPARGKAVTIRAIKGHKRQKDAPIGEVQVERAKGRMELELHRGGKPRGTLLLSITDGPPLPSQPPPPPDASASSTSERGKPTTPAAAASPGFVSSLLSLLSCVAQLCSVQDANFLRQKEGEAGVMRQPSGLLYKVLKRGQGQRHPKPDAVCVCHYRGTLVNGKEFDSTYGDNKPFPISPNQVIPGWCEALQLMVEGDKWALYIPASLAYGERGVPNAGIPGGATLVFEIELLKIQVAARR